MMRPDGCPGGESHSRRRAERCGQSRLYLSISFCAGSSRPAPRARWSSGPARAAVRMRSRILCVSCASSGRHRRRPVADGMPAARASMPSRSHTSRNAGPVRRLVGAPENLVHVLVRHLVLEDLEHHPPRLWGQQRARHLDAAPSRVPLAEARRVSESRISGAASPRLK